MDVKWVKIKAWHGVNASEHRPDVGRDFFIRTFCGRRPHAQSLLDTLPAEKSCESCLRIIARLSDG